MSMNQEIKHHLSDDILMAYAAGSLPEAFNLIVAAHVSLCDICRAGAESYDAVGGALLQDDVGAELSSDSLASTMALISGNAPSETPRAFRPGVLPGPLQDYVGGDLDAIQWRPVEKKVDQWHKLYAGMHAKPFSRPILSFQDGGTFLIIRQRKYKAEKESHRLTRRSREIYLFCQTNRSIKQILAKFDGLSQEKLIPFLTMMVDKHLMFKEND